VHATELIDLDQDLVERAGLRVGPEPTLRPLFAPGVHTTFGLPEVIA
jgi:uncharacterized protein YqjF (DUF2071 family)